MCIDIVKRKYDLQDNKNTAEQTNILVIKV